MVIEANKSIELLFKELCRKKKRLHNFVSYKIEDQRKNKKIHLEDAWWQQWQNVWFVWGTLSTKAWKAMLESFGCTYEMSTSVSPYPFQHNQILLTQSTPFPGCRLSRPFSLLLISSSFKNPCSLLISFSHDDT